jgi:hypothetical protein
MTLDFDNTNGKNPPPGPIERLLGQPDRFLLRFEGNDALLVEMNRRAYRDSIFCDTRRISRAGDKIEKIPWHALADACDAAANPPRDIFYVFHMAHCGSTLLARALDIENENIVYREPEALKQLGMAAAATFFPDDAPAPWLRQLGLVVRLLARSYSDTGPIIVKGNLPTNTVIPQLLDFTPDTRAIFLYCSLENYLLAVLKSDVHRKWVTGVNTYLSRPIDCATGTSVQQRQGFPVAKAAACIWLTQAALFHETIARYPRSRSLGSEQLFSDPGPVLEKAFQFFGQSFDDQQLNQIVNSEIFSRHSKFPDVEFNNDVRLNERRNLKRRLSTEIEEARHWAYEQIQQRPMPMTFDRSLTGTGSDLLASAYS